MNFQLGVPNHELIDNIFKNNKNKNKSMSNYYGRVGEI